MKPYIYFILPIFLIFLAATSQFTKAQQKNQLFQNVLNASVNKGLVDYETIKSNPDDLNNYLAQSSETSTTTFDSWSKAEQLAFLINLYNAQTLALVAENYPVKSIKDISADSGGPWEQPIVNLFGKKITLNALEHEVIRKNYPEPRIHFALVCAALGCPVLINTPYEAETLDTQLEEQTKVFLSSKDNNSIDMNQKILMLSPIFDWYEEDFSATSGSVLEFVNPYFDNQANSDFKIVYTNYDWSLNDQISTKKQF